MASIPSSTVPPQNAQGPPEEPNPQPPTLVTDTDQVMGSVEEPVAPSQPVLASNPTPTDREASAPPPSRFTIRIPSQMNYANALKRTADQSGNGDDHREEEQSDHEEEVTPVATVPRWPRVSPSGPIKGFSTKKVLENLDLQVKETWQSQAQEAVFVHYLDGGYNLNIAQNVHTIAKDLQTIYEDVYEGIGTIDPTVVHPTAATPLLHNQYAAPFMFLVTDIPYDFRRWLVSFGVHQVSSHLGLIFVENGEPVPHDYVMTLTNYNMRTETELLRAQAHHTVRRSVVDLLFDKPSDTSQCITDFVSRYRDNMATSFSNEEARTFVKQSVLIDSLDIVVPGTKMPSTVYNLYIHPPTANPDLLERWREFIAAQKFYAGINGVGVQYQFPFRCLHCKTIDHPSGLCTRVKELKGKAGKREEALTAEEILPLGPTPGPSTRTPNPNHGKRGGSGSRTTANNTRGRGSGRPTRGNAVRTNGSKKRKVD
ncbi:hypothetical protein BJ322DRAFT_1110179 [Thelephora terrestris]|uniref:Uncharacterized protein n=1 Tax=Thelephora terrestris TaxID=56493 RepID=A0A9P6HB64_9AGAM|nr:hypothetical protein BJ322DRAFT_1110179 [Thelephora terrestris]